ncbi:MAG TPA: hypothetical protein ENJ79_07775 [Gammaproteobacteria bacterium]|nr:hypothetical protein [Gammaproteobacteria bacterium]
MISASGRVTLRDVVAVLSDAGDGVELDVLVPGDKHGVDQKYVVDRVEASSSHAVIVLAREEGAA